MNLKAIAPKKSLGQNFLIDKNISRKIVSLLEINNDDKIFEIGPGTGALTSIILENNCNLTAIEIDERAVIDLKSKFSENEFPNFTLINQNFKDYNFEKSSEKPLKIIGNIPYYLSSEIIFKLLEADINIKCAVLTIQKELAERLVANANSKDYGILTLAMNMKANCKIEFNISPQCFYPVPNVWSSVIKISFFEKAKQIENYKEIMKIIRLAFNQRRKMISNTLKINFNKINYNEVDENDKAKIISLINKRPEQLIINDFVFLYNIFSNFSKIK